jgi:hypothetical protein
LRWLFFYRRVGAVLGRNFRMVANTIYCLRIFFFASAEGIPAVEIAQPEHI